MHFDWWTFALQAVNFAVLVWLLNRFLYRPVRRLLEARREEIEQQYAACATTKAQLQQQLAAVAIERSDVAKQREGLLKEAAAQADQLVAKRCAVAEHDAQVIVEQARHVLEAERLSALAETRRVAVDLASDMARRLLRETPVDLNTEACLERIERYLADLPSTEREQLVLSVRAGVATPAGGCLRITTATPLKPSTVELWKSLLQRALGHTIGFEFETDPALLAGAELHFPLATLRLSWQAMLAGMRSEIESMDVAPDAVARQ